MYTGKNRYIAQMDNIQIQVQEIYTFAEKYLINADLQLCKSQVESDPWWYEGHTYVIHVHL